MECEICGSQDARFVAIIEGAKLNVCGKCASMGKVVQGPASSAPAPSQSFSRSLSLEFDLVDGFGSIIRSARMRMKLPLSVLAERLAEKESFLERIEAEKTRPSIELAKKLEKELNVKLLEPAEPSSMPAIFEPSRKSSGRTLGDVVEFERKEKKK